jgi:hypothetical protein
MDRWLDRLRREIEEATRGLGEAEWGRAPEGRWNSAQIVEHLGRTYGGTAKMLERGLSAGGRHQLRPVTLKERWLQFLIVRMGRFPTERKAPAFALPEGEAGPQALERALSGLERMSTALDAAEQRWGSSQPVGVHFVLGPMNPQQWRKFHYLHGHHHVLQIRQRAGG